ncbi:MAG TPA: DUF58 domain-containing protein [Deltaproteobacteria bacterium]|nr:DUF58 domain-containing protein [Deltaproteobacteria bacterium]
MASRDELIALGKRVGASPASGGPRVATPLAGPHRSRFHGPGMEFAEVRAYQPGDDIRTIDWRVTARTGRAHSKLFEAERERPAWFVVDLGQTMQFATRGAFKSVAAARAVSLMAWQAHLAGEPIGGSIRSPESALDLTTGRTRRHLMRFLDRLASGTRLSQDATSPSALGEQLEWVRRRARSGSRIIVASDFYALDDEVLRNLRSLARRCESTFVWIYDALEAEAPPPGRYRVSDGRHTESLVAKRASAWRERYRSEFEARRRTLRKLARDTHATLIPMRTDEPAEKVLDPRLSGSVAEAV